MNLKERNTTDRAVSPVIGVILMVAITVILAAVIGTFVLGLGSGTQSNATAGVSFDETGSGISVTLNSLGDNTKNVTLKGGGCTETPVDLTAIGGSTTLTNCTSQINVVANSNSGKSNVVQTYDP